MTLKPRPISGNLPFDAIAKDYNRYCDRIVGDAGGLFKTYPVLDGISVMSGLRTFAPTANVTVGVDRRTFIATQIEERVIQDGHITEIQIDKDSIGTSIEFCVYRENGANYDLISRSGVIPTTGIGVQTIILPTPIACSMGDILGFSIVAGFAPSVNVTPGPAGALRFVATAGDMPTSDPFTSALAFSLDIRGYSVKPYLAVSGDSIAEGHNTVNKWHSFYDTGPTGTRASEIMNQLRNSISSTFEYQNHAKGSQTFAWVASTGGVSAFASGAASVLVHCGVNDVATGRTWAAVEADLDTIAGLVGAGQTLYLDEILPWTGGDDTQAATIRTFNANMSVWAAANSAVLVLCHDAMGQIRVSTGELDDLLTAYNFDNVHLTQAGVDKMASIWKSFL